MNIRTVIFGAFITLIVLLLIAGTVGFIESAYKYHIAGAAIIVGPATTWVIIRWLNNESDEDYPGR